MVDVSQIALITMADALSQSIRFCLRRIVDVGIDQQAQDHLEVLPKASDAVMDRSYCCTDSFKTIAHLLKGSSILLGLPSRRDTRY